MWVRFLQSLPIWKKEAKPLFYIIILRNEGNMKKSIKLFSGISTAVIAAIPVCFTSCSQKANESEVHILHINDIHGQIPGYGDDFYDQAKTWAGAIRLARDTQDIISKYPGSIFLSGGDSNSMGQFANCNDGDSMYPVMSAMDIRYSVVGNHAWDYGAEKLEGYHFDHLGRTKDTVGNYFVTSNIIYGAQYREKTWASDPTTVDFNRDYQIWLNTRVKWADPYKIIDMNGHNVAIIGLTTDGVYNDGKQSELTNISALDYISAINYTKRLMSEENSKETMDSIDAWVLLTHCSAHVTPDGELDPNCDAAANIAAKLDKYSNIDAILCGHSHKQVVGTIHNEVLDKDIWLGEAGWKGEAFVDTRLVFDENKKPGQRLKEVSMELKHPSIQSESWDKAHQELEELAQTATNEVVKATIKTYEQQKEVTKVILGRELGHTSGLDYTYTGSTRGYQAPTVVEQAGAWSQKSQIGGFNSYFDEEIKAEEVQKVSVGIISPDSLGGKIDAGDFLVRDCYKIFQFENHITYGVLTYSQLEQLCNYVVAGNIENPTHYDYQYPFFYDKHGGSKPVYTSSDDYTGLPWNPYQWYGFTFNVTKTTPTPENNWRQYEYTDNSLTVYDPEDGNLEDPTTWKGKDYWENGDGSPAHYIGFTLSNFNFDYETGALNICELWGKYNAKNNPGVKAYQNHAFTEVVQRQLVEAYCETLDGSNIELPENVLKQLIVIPE